MRQSHLFTKTRREAPADEVAKNAQFLIRGGFVHKEMAGVYSFLPLGLRVLEKVCGIIRKEMKTLGAEEIFFSSLQNRVLWQTTDRWDDERVDNWFKTKMKSGTEVGLGFTHEEPITAMLKTHLHSFRDLPLSLFQIQTKFRNETRAKSGIMRCREFLMKDLYSFSRTLPEHEAFYEKVKGAYRNIFDAVGIGGETFLTFAAGGTFSKYSHEFQTVTEAGEDTIHLCEKCRVAVNEEILHEQKTCPVCGTATLTPKRAVEVGNIFSLGTRFAEALRLTYRDEGGKEAFPIMGSYGLGLARLIGAVVEIHSDSAGIIWPRNVSPFEVHLISVDGGKEEVRGVAEELYRSLSERGVSVLFDDRDARAGEKFADADLIGIPYRAVVSERSLKEGGIELKERGREHIVLVPKSDIPTFTFA
ncbi:MAG: prolyl-tRNA synthetase [Parcubacteria group bacterium Gr01-1014_72]|nr:MAG: prolyl-tRNA synthetase [Parcubacteria group bacterium Gr01-1014_72]